MIDNPKPEPLQGAFVAAGLNADLLETIQRIAHQDGRMANQMAESAVETLQALAAGEEVGERELKNATQLLEFVSRGTLAYVQELQGRFRT